MCKEKVQACAGKCAPTPPSTVPHSWVTKLWSHVKTAIHRVKGPPPCIKGKCSYEKIILWFSFWPMMWKTSIMWNFWGFLLYFKRGRVPISTSFRTLFVLPGMLDTMAGVLATTQKWVTWGQRQRSLGLYEATQPVLNYVHWATSVHQRERKLSCSHCHYLGFSVTCSQTQSKL